MVKKRLKLPRLAQADGEGVPYIKDVKFKYEKCACGQQKALPMGSFPGDYSATSAAWKEHQNTEGMLGVSDHFIHLAQSYLNSNCKAELI